MEKNNGRQNTDRKNLTPFGSEADNHYRKWQESNRMAVLKIIVMAVVLFLIFALSFNLGRYNGISSIDAVKILIDRAFKLGWEFPENYETVIIHIRFPRIFAAMLIGFALAISGSAYQTVFRNPLVSPDILGASSGASLGAAIAIFSGLSGGLIQVLAFAGAAGAVLLAVLVSRKVKRDPTLALVLSGVIISSLANAIVSMIKFLADPNDKLPAITYWLMGSLANIGLSDLPIAIILISTGAIPLILLRWRLNVLSMGDMEAKSLGVETGRLRMIVIACATLLTAASISLGGLIGWVGLVIPHLMRIFVGTNNKVLIPASCIAGAVFLLVVDDIARSFASIEIPIGVLTAIIGAPFFVVLITTDRRGKSQ